MTTVIVLGLGAMGSATAHQLAQRGHSVLGFDQFHPPHTYGSSHGQTRIIRQSYWEDVRYVPLLLRAYDLWRELENETGKKLLHTIGGLMIGHPDSGLVAGSIASAQHFKLPHQILSAAEMRAKFPAFLLEDEMIALWEQVAGYLLPEECVRLQLQLASTAGADLHFHEPILEWNVSAEGGVSVRTTRAIYSADHLVLAAGPWAPDLLQSLGLPLQATRQVLYWFEPAVSPELFHADRMPVYIYQTNDARPMLYGFPFSGPESAGIKVALHGSQVHCTPENIDRIVRAEDEAAIRDRLAETIPFLAGRLLHAETCLYTMTPDEHFVIDAYPGYSQVSIAAGFSGHGFKFSSVVGEILADMATGKRIDHDLGLFSLHRFNSPQVSQ